METGLFFSHPSKFEAAGSVAPIPLCTVGVAGCEGMAVCQQLNVPSTQQSRALLKQEVISPHVTQDQNIPLRNLLESLV